MDHAFALLSPNIDEYWEKMSDEQKICYNKVASNEGNMILGEKYIAQIIRTKKEDGKDTLRRYEASIPLHQAVIDLM